ncbi:MAG: hypothetical protein Q9161_008645 [Pseudevernia consocians]
MINPPTRRSRFEKAAGELSGRQEPPKASTEPTALANVRCSRDRVNKRKNEKRLRSLIGAREHTESGPEVSLLQGQEAIRAFDEPVDTEALRRGQREIKRLDLGLKRQVCQK